MGIAKKPRRSLAMPAAISPPMVYTGIEILRGKHMAIIAIHVLVLAAVYSLIRYLRRSKPAPSGPPPQATAIHVTSAKKRSRGRRAVKGVEHFESASITTSPQPVPCSEQINP